MKFKKYLFILLIALICIIGISAAAASDANDLISQDNNQGLVLEETNHNFQITNTQTDVSTSNSEETSNVSKSNTQTDVSTSNLEETTYVSISNREEPEDNNNIIHKENKKTSLKDEETDSFTNLNNLINIDNPNNHTISLNFNYVFSEDDYSYTDGIIISRELTIEGNGHSIDASHKARIFLVNTPRQVIFKNIKFLNGNSSEGGAIYISNSNMNCTAINSNFTRNFAITGGAIYKGTAENCTFTLNFAQDSPNQYEGQSSGCTYIDTATLSSSDLTTSPHSNERLLFNLSYNGEILSDVDVTIKISRNGVEKATYNVLSDEGSLPIDLNPGIYKAKLMVENSNVPSIEVTISANPEGSPFYLLNQAINDNSNTEITLDRNYTFDSSVDSGFRGGIYIDRSLKLDGNGFTINGFDGGRIFIITADNVVITNINFANGKSDNGGAILWLGKNGNISNCNFTDNIATVGGAIFWGNTNLRDKYSNRQGDDGTIINCSFIGNYARKGGAMFFHTCGATIKDSCAFHNNTGSEEGGALFWLDYGGKIENNCNFTFNTAKGSGGAIYCPQAEILNNCSFENNTAQSKSEDRIMKGGGAIYFQKGGTVNGCIFIGNIALNDGSDGLRFYKGGGAIYIERNAIVSNCTFIDNSAEKSGGAINVYESGNISNCIFTNNHADLGGTVQFSLATGSLEKSIITESHATDGTAIGLYGSEIRVNQNIILNTEGNKIYLNDSSNSNIEDNWFGNTLLNYDEEPYEGCTNWIFLNGESNPISLEIPISFEITFTLSSFNKNTGKISEYDDGKLPFNLTAHGKHGNLSPNTDLLGKTAIYETETATVERIIGNVANIDSEFEIMELFITDGTTFYDLNQLINSNSDKEINISNNYTYYEDADFEFKEGININRSLTINGNGFAINGLNSSRIFNINGDNVTINNISLINGNGDEDIYDSSGGAIYWKGADGTLIQSNFTNNSGYNGGAIYWEGDNGRIINSTFTNNNAYDGGGAITITVESGITLINNTFTNNNASYNGGAIYLIASSGEIINNTFTNNRGYNGGGIFCFVDNLSIINNTMESNIASDDNGGAISWEGEIGKIINNTFTNNKASEEGGAICISVNRAEIINNTFTNNNASYRGGAISIIISSKGEIINNTFTNNSGYDGGGIICFGNNVSIINNTMESNIASYNGGAIYVNMNYAMIINNTLKNNTGKSKGGAIYWERRDGIISLNIIANNKANQGGAIYYDSYSSKLNYNIILNNKNSEIYFNKVRTFNGSNNWFGNNASNYFVNPNKSFEYSNSPNVKLSDWLFLNATASPKTLNAFESSQIIFKLYSFNGILISKYDNTLIADTKLNLSAERGTFDKTSASFDEPINYTAIEGGIDKIRGAIDNSGYSITVTNKKISSNIAMDPQEICYSRNASINLDYNDLAVGNVTIRLNGENNEYLFENMSLNKTLFIGAINRDSYDIRIEYSGDGTFLEENISGSIIVNKARTEIVPTNDTMVLSIGEKSKVNYTFYVIENEGQYISKPEDIGNISFKSDGSAVEVDSKTGEINAVKEGTASILITFKGDGNHLDSNASAYIIASNKPRSKITAENLTTDYKKDDYIIARLTNATGNPIANATLTVELNGTANYTTDSNGTIKVPTKGLDSNEYIVKIHFEGNENYTESIANIRLIVNKLNTEITANNITTSYYISKELVIRLKDIDGDPINGVNITVDLNGINNYTTDSNGQAIVEIKGLIPNNYTARISFEGNENYNKSSTESDIEILKVPSILNGTDMTVNYNEDKYMVVSLKYDYNNPISNATISVELDGINNYTTDSNGQIKVPTKELKPNTYTAKITFEGNEIYEKTNASAKITVNKGLSKINTTNITVNYKEDKYLVVNLKNNDNNPISNATISVELDGINNYTTDSNGQIKVPTKELKPNTYTAIIKFEGTEIYEKSNATAKVTVNKISSKMTASNVTARYGDNQNIIISLKDNDNNPLSGFKVSINLNGKKDYTTDSAGQVKVSTKDLVPDTYKAIIVFAGNENYTGSNASASVRINRINTAFNYSNMDTIAFDSNIEGRVGEYFCFKLLDEDGKPLSGKQVFIGFNGVKYNRTTNETGEARLQINLKYANHYTFAIAFLGDDYYRGSFNVALISVTEQTPIISTSAKTYKSSAKTKALTATLKSSRGQPLTGKKISFTLNGKVYTANTNSQGLATVKVSLSKKGTYSFTVQFAGDSTYKKVTKSSKLTIK